MAIDPPSRAAKRAALIAALACLLGGCGSASQATVAAGTATAGTAAACQSVAAVLSDGPDPGADPVGYAEAQVVPLRQLDIKQARLRVAVAGLASAYKAYSASDGAHATKPAVSVAVRRVNAICPGAAG